jgi:hypothetical protein
MYRPLLKPDDPLPSCANLTTQFREGGDAFSEMPDGPRRARPSRRTSSFQGVTEWGTPWLPDLQDREEQRRGEACPPAVSRGGVRNPRMIPPKGRESLGIEEKVSPPSDPVLSQGLGNSLPG